MNKEIEKYMEQKYLESRRKVISDKDYYIGKFFNYGIGIIGLLVILLI